MTDTRESELLALAERCEKATGPDRELDGLIYQTVDFVIKDCWPHWNNLQREQIVPHYTASTDAAKSLLLDFMSIEMTESAAGSGFTRCRIWDWRRGPKMMDSANEWKAEGNRPLPLNICAAALRARAASENRP